MKKIKYSILKRGLGLGVTALLLISLMVPLGVSAQEAQNQNNPTNSDPITQPEKAVPTEPEGLTPEPTEETLLVPEDKGITVPTLENTGFAPSRLMGIQAASDVTFNDGTITYAANTVTGEATVTGLVDFFGFSGTVTIPATITNSSITYNVVAIGDEAFRESYVSGLDLTGAINLETIGEAAFLNSNTQSLRGKVAIPAKVVSIGNAAFGFNRITELDLTGATSLKTIGNSAFNENSITENLSIPASVTSIGREAFAYSGIRELDLTGASSLKTIGYSAFECSTITGNLSIPASVISIGYEAFSWTNLENIIFKGATQPTLGQDSLIGWTMPPVAWYPEGSTYDFTDTGVTDSNTYKPTNISGPTEISMKKGTLESPDTFNVSGTEILDEIKVIINASNPAIEWDNATKSLKLSGALPVGTYPITLTASNMFGSDSHGVTLIIEATIAQIFPDGNLAQAVADAVSDGNVDAVLTSAMINGLTSLTATSKDITDLTGIGSLEKLTYLGLTGNQISVVPEELGNLVNLTGLYLDNNILTDFPNAICELTNLGYLSLAQNSIPSLPAEFFNLTKMVSVYLNNNQLSEIQPEIANFTQLKNLQLGNNKLTSIQPKIFELANLKQLWIYGNKLGYVSPDIQKLTKLETLHISQTELTNLPEELCNVTSLNRIELEKNQLTSLPAGFGKLENLTTLKLENNLLPSNYATVLNPLLPSMDVVYENQNQLSIKEEAIKTYTIESGNDYNDILLSTLIDINTGGSRNSALAGHDLILDDLRDKNNQPVSLESYLKNGEVIKVGNVTAKIRATGEGLFPNTSDHAITLDTITLNFEGTTIAQTFPDENLAQAVADVVSEGDLDAVLTPTRINELISLDAGSRGIADLTGIEKLVKLETLNLRDNKLSSLPDSFVDLIQLKELNLSHNHFVSLPDYFGGLASLEILFLDHNQLTSLPTSFGDLSRLRELKLGYNLLPTNYHATLNTLDFDFTVVYETQDQLKIKDNGVKVYDIINRHDLDNIPLQALVEVDEEGTLIPMDSDHSFCLDNFVDEKGAPVDLTTYLSSGVVQKTGTIYAQVRSMGTGLFPNTSDHALSTQPVQLNFKGPETPTNPAATPSSSTNTGDNRHLLIWGLGLMGALGALVLVKRRKAMHKK